LCCAFYQITCLIYYNIHHSSLRTVELNSLLLWYQFLAFIRCHVLRYKRHQVFWFQVTFAFLNDQRIDFILLAILRSAFCVREFLLKLYMSSIFSAVLEMLELINRHSTFVVSSHYSDLCSIAYHHWLCK